jgi:uncharacterized membrane protein YeaQ/YmgE (transglycosylase-associated protein family)
MTFEGFMTWIVVGLLIGALAWAAAKDRGHGLMVDVTLGLSGSLMGSLLYQIVGGSQEAGWLVLAAMMCVGAAGLIVAQRAAWPRRA